MSGTMEDLQAPAAEGQRLAVAQGVCDDAARAEGPERGAD
jgi:hypothetical protein